MSPDVFDPTSARRVVLIDTTSEMSATLMVDSWERKIVEVKEKPIVFGRIVSATHSDVSLPAHTIAKRLFEIRWNAKQNRHEVQLYNSVHPFSLNGALLKDLECRPLSVGDVLTIAPFKIEYTRF